jgi:hypothetical protein
MQMMVAGRYIPSQNGYFNCRMDFRWDKFTVTQHLKEMGVMSD